MSFGNLDLGLGLGGDSATGAAGGGGSTFDPLNKGTTAVLSSGNKNLMNSVDTSHTAARGAQGRNSGFFCFEFKVIAGGDLALLLGLADGTTLNGSPLDSPLGFFPNSVGWRGDVMYSNGTFSQGSILNDKNPVPDDVVTIACNFSNKSIWWAYNNVWQGGGGTPPSTGSTAGRSAFFSGTPTLFPCAAVVGFPSTVRLLTGAGELTYPLRPGFSAWG